MKKNLPAAVLFLSVPLVFARQPENSSSGQDTRYGYAEIRQAVVMNNPDILKLQEEYNRSLIDVRDAWGGLGPTVDMQISGTYMMNPPGGPLSFNVDDIINSVQWPAGVRPVSSGQYVRVYDGMENTLYNLSLSMTQPLFTWGKIPNAIKLYRQIAGIKELQLSDEIDRMDTELETRLMSLSHLYRILDILEEEQTYADKMVTYSEDAEKSGMLLHQDVVDARIKAKELEIARQDLNEQIADQLLELQRMSGIDGLERDTIDYSFDGNIVSRIMAFDRTESEEKALSGERNSLKMVTRLVDVNRTAEKIARGSVNWKPDFALQVSAGYGGSRVPLFEPNWYRKDDYTLNFSLGIKTTVWDGGKKVNDVARKISESNTAELEQSGARSTIRQTLMSQWNTADVCTMKIEYQDLKIEAADSKIAQQQLLFDSGYGSETDLLSAKIDRCNERIEREKQSLSRAAACLAISYLCGIPVR